MSNDASNVKINQEKVIVATTTSASGGSISLESIPFMGTGPSSKVLNVSSDVSAYKSDNLSKDNNCLLLDSSQSEKLLEQNILHQNILVEPASNTAFQKSQTAISKASLNESSLKKSLSSEIDSDVSSPHSNKGIENNLDEVCSVDVYHNPILSENLNEKTIFCGDEVISSNPFYSEFLLGKGNNFSIENSTEIKNIHPFDTKKVSQVYKTNLSLFVKLKTCKSTFKGSGHQVQGT